MDTDDNQNPINNNSPNEAVMPAGPDGSNEPIAPVGENDLAEPAVAESLNEPIAPAGTADSTEPIAPAGATDSAEPVAADTQGEPMKIEVTTEEVVEVSEPATGEAPKKKKTGLIVGLIVGFLVLVCGGGFAAFAIIKNLPENIAMNAFDNLAKAESVTVDGDFTFSPKNVEGIGVQAVNVKFDSKLASAGEEANASITVDFSDDNSVELLNIGQVMMKDGVFYLKVDGLEESYQQNVRGIVEMYLTQWIGLQTQTGTVTDCLAEGEEYIDCESTTQSTTEYDSLAMQYVNQIMGTIDEVVASIDGQWFEFSVEDILNSDLIAEQLMMPEATRQQIISSYNCSIDMMSRFSTDYAKEFTDLYAKYPFLQFKSGQDGYYNVTLDSKNLNSYRNDIAKSNYYKDLGKCMNAEIDESLFTQESSSEIVDGMVENMPNVAMKFDGFLDHHLTNVKVNQSADYYDMNMNVKLGYPSGLAVEAPADSRPIMDLVDEVYNSIMQLFGTF